MTCGLTASAPAQQRVELSRKSGEIRDVSKDLVNDEGYTTGLSDAPSATRSQPTEQLTFKDRVSIYRKTMLRPYSLISPAFGAGIGQWEDEPPEWGQGSAG